MNTPIELVLARLKDARRSGTGWVACCPSHEDSRPSLSISEGDDGRALVHCFAGCPAEAVCGTLGLSLAELMPPDDWRRSRPPLASPSPKSFRSRKKTVNGRRRRLAKTFAAAAEAVEDLDRWKGPHTATWAYHNASGEPVGLAVRFDDGKGGKEVLPVRRNGDGRWQLGATPEPRPLYRLPELLADGESTIYVVEGEKCADVARSIGLLATTSAGGCKAASKADWSPLAGRSVVVLPDNDGPGAIYTEAVVAALHALANPATVRVANLPGLPEGGDFVDWLAANGDADHG